MGEAGEAQNITHQQKKMGTTSLKAFRNRFGLDIPDDKIDEVPYLTFAKDSAENVYMQERRKALGGAFHRRKTKAEPLQVPPLSAFESLLKASAEGHESSTTMAYVRILNILVKDKKIGKHVVPIVADESRTFGMEGMFRQLGIWSSVGQLYTPQDADQLMYYKEDKHGQILQEGICEAGAMSSWIAAATSYSTHGIQMIPFFIFYSMFGFQRVGDLAWAAGDMRCRGFLLGGTAGRTTLNGEGLQHEDGHSHIVASTIPNCVSYDPAFAYELAVIIQAGMQRMFADNEAVFYYIAVMNENYVQPPMPKGVEPGILKGMYKLQTGGRKKLRVNLMGSGTILRECQVAVELLEKDFGVSADVYSVPSFGELRRDALDCERWNMLHPAESPRVPYVQQLLEKVDGPFVAATDYMRLVPDQIRQWIPGRYVTLGTDGFGRSDAREALRQHFEVDRNYIVVAALYALAADGRIEPNKVDAAIAKLGIDPAKPNPLTV